MLAINERTRIPENLAPNYTKQIQEFRTEQSHIAVLLTCDFKEVI